MQFSRFSLDFYPAFFLFQDLGAEFFFLFLAFLPFFDFYRLF